MPPIAALLVASVTGLAPPTPSTPLIGIEAHSASESGTEEEGFFLSWKIALMIVLPLLAALLCYRYAIRRHPIAKDPKVVMEIGSRLGAFADRSRGLVTAPSTSVQISRVTRLEFDLPGGGIIEARASPRMEPPESLRRVASEPALPQAFDEMGSLPELETEDTEARKGEGGG